MGEKRSHLGMAGHYAAMSEFLLRGYNVTVPAVDLGDDVFVVDDQQGALWRVQVKTGDKEIRPRPGDTSQKTVRYNLSRQQLQEEKQSELFFMLMARWDGRWRFLLLSRDRLVAIRDDFVARDRTGKSGPKPKSDAEAKTDTLIFDMTWTEADAVGWGVSFKDYMDAWPDAFPDLRAAP